MTARSTVTPKQRASIAVVTTIVGPGIPAAYMAITGHAPMWARIWYLVWFVIGCLITIGKAAKA